MNTTTVDVRLACEQHSAQMFVRSNERLVGPKRTRDKQNNHRNMLS